MARNAPPAEEEERELTIEIRLPAGMKLRQVIALEEAMSAGVKPFVDWLVAYAGCDHEQLLELGWEQIDLLRAEVKHAVIAAGAVPPRKS